MKSNIQVWFTIGIVFYCLATTGKTQAQVIPDATLPNNSKVTPDGNINIITGGTVAGSNLFHSFEQFSVPTGSAAHFNNAPNIQNIVSRVTGESISNIDGKLQANGAANLFLLNPNGIIFGPNATLSIGGSIVASTASSLNFAVGTKFSAIAQPTTPLLTVSVPVGLQFGGKAGSIRVQGSGNNLSVDSATGAFVRGEISHGLVVQPGKTLALVGGEVTLQGGNLIAKEGQISVGSVAGSGLVSLTPTIKGWTLGYSGVSSFQDIQLSRRASVDASGPGGGDIQIQGRRVTITDGSAIFALTLGSKPGGTVTVDASDSVEVIGTSADSMFLSAVFTDTEGAGTGGDLTITTPALLVQNGAAIAADTLGAGDAGNLTVNADTSVKLWGTSADGQFASSLSTKTQGNGAAGDLTVTTRALLVQEGAVVSASTSGTGKAGTLAVNASDLVQLSGTAANGSLSRLVTTTQGVEAAGDLTITTGQLIVQNGAVVITDTFGSGDGGNLSVNADTSVKLRGTSANTQFPSGLFAQVQPQATGNGGNLTIATGELRIENGAIISNATFGEGSGGRLEVKASELAQLSGTSDGQRPSLLTTVTQGIGDAGDLKIETGKLIVQDGGNVSASTLGQGQGGTLDVTASNFVEVIGSSPRGFRSALSARAGGLGDKAAGNLRINTLALIVRDGARVTVSAQQARNAGDLQLKARSIRLDNQGAIIAETESGNGGNIRLQDLDLLLLRRNSQISTQAGTNEIGGGGNGGDITVNTDLLVALPSENSDIIANAFDGRGGNVEITTQSIFGIQFQEEQTLESDITASSRLGIDGEVEINTPDVDPTQGLVELPAELVDASRLIATGCASGGESVATNEFIITGRGGLPPSPSDPLSAEAVLADWATLPNRDGEAGGAGENGEEVYTDNLSLRSLSAPSAPPPSIVEAQGWIINNKGEVVLTATAPTHTPHIPLNTPAQCHTPETY